MWYHGDVGTHNAGKRFIFWQSRPVGTPAASRQRRNVLAGRIAFQEAAVIYIDPTAVPRLTDVQLARAIGQANAEANRLRAEFDRTPCREFARSWQEALEYAGDLQMEQDTRATRRLVRSMLLRCPVVRIQL